MSGQPRGNVTIDIEECKGCGLALIPARRSVWNWQLN